MVLVWRAVSDAIFGEAVFAFCAREVSQACETIRRLVPEEWLCAGRIPAKSRGARRANTAEGWVQSASSTRSATDGAEGTTEAGLECRGGGGAGGRKANLRGRLTR